MLGGYGWGQGDTSDESSDEDVIDSGSESEDNVEELSDEEDDDAVRGRMNFDAKFKFIDPPHQTLQFVSPDKRVWTNTIPTSGRRSIVNKWTCRDKHQGVWNNVPRVAAAKSKLDMFKLLITDEMTDSIVHWTNVNAVRVLELGLNDDEVEAIDPADPENSNPLGHESEDEPDGEHDGLADGVIGRDRGSSRPPQSRRARRGRRGSGNTRTEPPCTESSQAGERGRSLGRGRRGRRSAGRGDRGEEAGPSNTRSSGVSTASIGGASVARGGGTIHPGRRSETTDEEDNASGQEDPERRSQAVRIFLGTRRRATGSLRRYPDRRGIPGVEEGVQLHEFDDGGNQAESVDVPQVEVPVIAPDIPVATECEVRTEEDQNPEPKIRKWKPTDRTEMTAFMGLLILAGVERVRKVPTHFIWTSDPKYRKPPFVATMSRERFHDLLRFTRFDDKSTRKQRKQTDKLAAIREFCDALQKNMFEVYEPGPHLTVDEMLVKFRGRCPFRVYMKSKPGRYGIKIWALADAESRFVCNFQVYLGKEGGAPERNQGKRVLMDMMRNFFGSWRGVTADNFFGSKDAAEDLMKEKITSVFTMRAIRREVPKQILDIKDLHDSKFLWNDNTMLVAYKAKSNKTVLLMSTQHQSPLIHKEPPHKPEVIFVYNEHKGNFAAKFVASQYAW